MEQKYSLAASEDKSFIYDAESWTMLTCDDSALRVYERKSLGTIYGYLHIGNGEYMRWNDKLYEFPSDSAIVKGVKRLRLKLARPWLLNNWKCSSLQNMRCSNHRWKQRKRNTSTSFGRISCRATWFHLVYATDGKQRGQGTNSAVLLIRL